MAEGVAAYIPAALSTCSLAPEVPLPCCCCCYYRFPPPSAYKTSYDGFTTLLTTRPVSIQAGQTYHFKLAVADAGDHVLDSAVWIAGGSLLVNSPPRVVDDGPYVLPCPGSITMHANATDDDHDDVRYSWDLMSSTGETLRGSYPGCFAAAGGCWGRGCGCRPYPHWEL